LQNLVDRMPTLETRLYPIRDIRAPRQHIGGARAQQLPHQGRIGDRVGGWDRQYALVFVAADLAQKPAKLLVDLREAQDAFPRWSVQIQAPGANARSTQAFENSVPVSEGLRPPKMKPRLPVHDLSPG
jgi:hypothetical protein